MLMEQVKSFSCCAAFMLLYMYIFGECSNPACNFQSRKVHVHPYVDEQIGNDYLAKEFSYYFVPMCNKILKFFGVATFHTALYIS